MSAPPIDPSPDRRARRRAVEDALLAFHEDVQDEFRDRLGSEHRNLEPQDALLALAGTDGIPRLIKHRALLDGLLRRPRGQARVDLSAAIESIVASTVPPGRSVHSDRMARVIDYLRDLPGGHLGQQEWRSWVAENDDLFSYTLSERTFTACNDEGTKDKYTPDGRSVGCRIIVAEFLSPRPPSDFARFVDPFRWTELSPFWDPMEALSDREDVAGGWNRRLRETVHVFVGTVKMPLSVGVRFSPDRVWCEFNVYRRQYLKKDDPPFSVDTGTVSAQLLQPGLTRVQSTKYLNSGGDPDYSKLACALGWAELMAEMAEESPEDDKSQEAQVSQPNPNPSIEKAINEFVTNVTSDYRKAVDETGSGLRTMLRRLTGDTWDPRWVNDLLAIGQVQLDKAGGLPTHIGKLADALRAAGDPPPNPPPPNPPTPSGDSSS